MYEAVHLYRLYLVMIHRWLGAWPMMGISVARCIIRSATDRYDDWQVHNIARHGCNMYGDSSVCVDPEVQTCHYNMAGLAQELTLYAVPSAPGWVLMMSESPTRCERNLLRWVFTTARG